VTSNFLKRKGIIVNMETTIFYILIFIIGALFGSFFTLAVYRIPLHQDITHKRSYCPNCNHKLSFLDMIPILSYIYLGGKCRYCKQKIRIRYLLLEVLTGTVFLLFAMSLKLNFYNVEISKLVYLIFGMLYIAGLIIIAGIDKEKRNINKQVLVYEIIILSIYMIYLYVVEKANIYRYVIYLFVMLLLFILDLKKDNYTVEIIILGIVQAIFTAGYGFLMTVTLTFMIFIVDCILKKIILKNKKYYSNLPIGFYLCISNIIILILINSIACWRI
jgi:leader peptidase (prepilin peptidase)/N-methyltransferase